MPTFARALLVAGSLFGLVGCPGGDPEVSGELPPDFQYLQYQTISVGDAGAPQQRTHLSVNASDRVTFYDGTVPIDATLTAAERQELGRMLNTPGALDAFLSPPACGSAAADFSETLFIGARGVDFFQKEMTGCQQAPFAALRAFVGHVRDNHFRFDAGTCPAPNVWRYMGPGCGAAAHPVCGSPSGDACAATRCSCDGRDIVGCDFTGEPYAHEGPCSARDGGGG